jgi:hypothetical protein
MAAKTVIITLFAAKGDVGGIAGCKAPPPRPRGGGPAKRNLGGPRLREGIITLFAAMGGVGGTAGCKAPPPRPRGGGPAKRNLGEPVSQKPAHRPGRPEDIGRKPAPGGGLVSQKHGRIVEVGGQAA